MTEYTNEDLGVTLTIEGERYRIDSIRPSRESLIFKQKVYEWAAEILNKHDALIVIKKG